MYRSKGGEVLKGKRYKSRVKAKRFSVMTFTKVWTGRLLWCGIVWITWSYVLATMGKADIAESLSSQVVQVVIGVTLGYMVKAFLDTYAEKRQEHKDHELEISKEIELAARRADDVVYEEEAKG